MLPDAALQLVRNEIELVKQSEGRVAVHLHCLVGTRLWELWPGKRSPSLATLRTEYGAVRVLPVTGVTDGRVYIEGNHGDMWMVDLSNCL